MEGSVDEYVPLAGNEVLSLVAILVVACIGLLVLVTKIAVKIDIARRQAAAARHVRNAFDLTQRRWILARPWIKRAITLLAGGLVIGASILITYAIGEYAQSRALTWLESMLGSNACLLLFALTGMPAICLFGAIPVARVLLRIRPVDPEQTVVPSRFTRWMFVGGLLSYACLVLIVAGFWAPVQMVGLWVTSGLLAWTGFLTHRHYAGFRTFLESPYVVFLRRFSTFSDRVLTGFVMRNLPAGVPIVILQSRVSGLQDWDPFAMGFNGMKLLFPIRSMPLVLSVSDERWLEWVERLAEKSSGVVLDLTEISPSVRSELAVLKAGGFDSKLILVADGNVLGSLETIRNEWQMGGSRQHAVLAYRRSWAAGALRLVIVLWLIVCFSLLLALPSEVRQAIPPALTPHSLIHTFENLHEFAIARWGLTIFGITFLVYGGIVTVKPFLTLESRIAIGNALDELFAGTRTPMQVAWSRVSALLKRGHEG